MEREEADAAKLERGIRFDFLIAVVALLISCITAAASLWQTHVISQQLSSQVWPYVSVSSSSSGRDLTVSIANDGAGPAVVESFVVLVDGKPQANFIAAFHALAGRFGVDGRVGRLSATFAEVDPGEVIRANGEVTILKIADNPLIGRIAAAAAARLQIRTCYCSILRDCWIKSSTAPHPLAVGRCEPVGAAQFRAPPAAAFDPKTL